MSGTAAATPETPKAKAIAAGVEVWCQFEELVPTAELKPNPRNPNQHPDAQIELLAKNIRYLGWRHPIVISKRSGLIVAGHGRLMAAKKLGVALVPVDSQNFATEADEMAVLVADNRLAELSETDEDALKKLLQELDGKIDLDRATPAPSSPVRCNALPPRRHTAARPPGRTIWRIGWTTSSASPGPISALASTGSSA